MPQHKEAVLNAQNRQATNSQRAFPVALDLETRIGLHSTIENTGEDGFVVSRYRVCLETVRLATS